jgi:mannose-6-phosphate isomerase-like protein (cupin superfamily)
MIRKAEDMIREIKDSMRGGCGQVELVQLFKPGEYAGKARIIARLTLNQGCSIGAHQHLHEEEIFYVISGQGLLAEPADGPETLLNAGDAALTISGGSHTIRNAQPEPLVLLAAVLLTD